MAALLGSASSVFAQQPASSGGQVEGAGAQIAQVLDANTLTGKGRTPFHLVVDFQLYGLDGRPSEEGTLEEWWTESDGTRMEITTPSLGTLHSLRLSELSNDAMKRSVFLIGELSGDIEAPGNHVPRAKGGVSEDKAFGATKLHCLTPAVEGPKGAIPGQETLCTDNTETIRVVSQPNIVLVRNSLGLFHGIKVALKEDLRYSDKTAITGSVTKLESFDPAHDRLALEKIPGEKDRAENANKAVIPGAVLAGEIIEKVQPEYPEVAKLRHQGGTVVLDAVITPEGKIANLFPVASPGEILTGAAVTAVRQWRYRPYLLNGVPTEVNTTISVNFHP